MDAFAPASAVHRLVPVVDNIPIARDTYRLRLADATIARAIKPGQFVMIRPGPEGATDPLLGRPLALYDVVRDPAGAPTAFDVVYLVVGRGTAALSQRRPGERVAVWGPLGNGFGPPPAGPVDPGRRRHRPDAVPGSGPLVARPGRLWRRANVARARRPCHGTGCRESASRLGFRRPRSPCSTVCGRPRSWRALTTSVAPASRSSWRPTTAPPGHHGYVTDILVRRLERGDRPAKVVGCGPPAMLATLAKIARQYDIPCDVSLENHMACGFGACFSCVAPIRQADGSTDLRRVCVEGPVVSADLSTGRGWFIDVRGGDERDDGDIDRRRSVCYRRARFWAWI